MENIRSFWKQNLSAWIQDSWSPVSFIEKQDFYCSQILCSAFCVYTEESNPGIPAFYRKHNTRFLRNQSSSWSQSCEDPLHFLECFGVKTWTPFSCEFYPSSSASRLSQISCVGWRLVFSDPAKSRQSSATSWTLLRWNKSSCFSEWTYSAFVAWENASRFLPDVSSKCSSITLCRNSSSGCARFGVCRGWLGGKTSWGCCLDWCKMRSWSWWSWDWS